MKRLVLFLSLLAAFEAHAEQASWVVILAGGKTTAEADAVVAKPAVDAVVYSPSFPKRFSSATVAGLKPGFEIAVAGFCPDEASAIAARDLLRAKFADAYVRKVTGPFAPSCPSKSKSLAPPERTSKADPKLFLEAGAVMIEVWRTPLADLGWGSDEADACGTLGLTLRAVTDGKVVHSLQPESECVGLCSDHGEIEPGTVCGADAVEWRPIKTLKAGAEALLIVDRVAIGTRTRSSAENPAYERHALRVFGFTCGEVRELFELPGMDEKALSITSSAEGLTVSDGKVTKTLRRTSDGCGWR